MGQPTQRFKKSMSGSIGAGMKSVLGGEGRRFFVIEHKVSSKYHKAGEEQKIIVDQIEIGRDSQCAVRLDGNDPNDKMFQIVSRKHAAIEKDGDNWTLVHLSTTNSTFLNGRRLSTPGQKWYLQNGDEIQIAESGPKLGFKIPQGDKGLVKSLRMTDRLNLFRQQALRPYKQAITALSCVFLLCACVGGYVIWDQGTTIVDMKKNIALYSNENVKMQHTIKQMEEKRMVDSINRRNDSINIVKLREDANRHKDEINRKQKELKDLIENNTRNGAQGIAAVLQSQNIEKDVYFLFTEKVSYIEGGEEIAIPNYGWSGTGFLLDDGRFVTARHCVEGWLYGNPTEQTEANKYILAAINTPNAKIKAYMKAVSSKSGNVFSFTSDQFIINRSLDKKAQIGNTDDGTPINWIFTYPALKGMNEKMWSTDWAYVKTTKTGNLHASAQLSRNLTIQQPLIVLGFPVGLGVYDGDEKIQPISSEVRTSRPGLASNGCILHSSGTDHGNSGGPIFAIENGKLVVVGIVSRGDMKTTQHNWAVPICNIN